MEQSFFSKTRRLRHVVYPIARAPSTILFPTIQCCWTSPLYCLDTRVCKCSGAPFMKDMEEIVYWVQTKRAPCLYKYDSLHNKQYSDAHSSKIKVIDLNTPSKDTVHPSPKKKKKRKLSILDESRSEKNEENVFFDSAAHPQQQAAPSSGKDSIISETDLNIKKSCVSKRTKVVSATVQSRKNPVKQNEIVSSTPKICTGSKRNLRSFEKTRLLDSSLESGLFSGETKNKQSSLSKTASRKSGDKYATGDHTHIHNKSCSTKVAEKQKSDNALNGLFDDISDVSGFTANYIRSTKRNSKKLNQAKKTNKQLIKESQNNNTDKHDENKLVVCLNKSVNTTGHPVHSLNCSTDSHILNLVSVEAGNGLNSKQCRSAGKRDNKLNKSTSVLKFLEPTLKNSDKISCTRRRSNNVGMENGLDSSFQSKSSVTSRYFTRSKVGSFQDLSFYQGDNAATPIKVSCKRHEAQASPVKDTTKCCNIKLAVKETGASKVKRKQKKQSQSVLVIDSTTEPVSSSASVNVADHVNKRLSGGHKDQNAAAGRENSGFSACFSDSDDDRPMRKKKFFA